MSRISTGFYRYKNLSGTDAASTIDVRVANSVTLDLGDAVRVNTSGFLDTADAGETVAGILQGFKVITAGNVDGVNPFSLGADVTGLTLTDDYRIAVSASNQTRTDAYLVGVVEIDPAGSILYYNDADEDLDATDDFAYFDVVSGSEGQIDASTVSNANGQFQLVSRDPDNDGNASKGLFRINESQFTAGLDTATAKRAA